MLGKTKPLHGRRNMKAISMMAVAAGIAFSAVAIGRNEVLDIGWAPKYARLRMGGWS
jgi:hypothetical protein